MGLTVGESKEDLHTRMTELQKKLKDSEDERRVLEKTCDILIKAFREEQKIYYNTLNEKYEKFLEDFNIRRKRNDIILKSLARVEDRAKAIHAKTEKLKLLKNRYISYLKQNEFLKVEESKGKFSAQTSKDAFASEGVGKSVHWKIPVVTSVQEFSTKDVHFLPESILGMNKQEHSYSNEHEKLESQTSKNVSMDYILNDTYLEKSIEERNSNRGSISPGSIDFNYIKPNENGHSPNAQPVGTSLCNSQPLSNIQSKLNSLYTEIANLPSFNKSQNGSSLSKADDSINENNVKHESSSDLPSKPKSQDSHSASLNLSSCFSSIGSTKKPDTTENIKSNSSDLNVVKELREIGILKHQESIDKLKDSLEEFKEIESTEAEQSKNFAEKGITGDDNKAKEQNEADVADVLNEQKKELIYESEIDNVLPRDGSNETEDVDNTPGPINNNVGDENLPSNKVTYLKGLDGVDYDNETYPESYYEQPVYHNNHTSLTSKVILEEDEYELDADQEELMGQNEHSSRNNGERKISLQESDNVENNQPVQTTEEHDVEAPRHGNNSSEGRDDGVKENFQKIHIDNHDEPLKRSDSDNVDLSKSVEYTGEEWLKGNVIETTTDDSKSEDSAKLDSDPPEQNINEMKNQSKKSLVHLVESDSESFQIEHGDMIYNNDDSDFDFSFKLNPE